MTDTIEVIQIGKGALYRITINGRAWATASGTPRGRGTEFTFKDAAGDTVYFNGVKRSGNVVRLQVPTKAQRIDMLRAHVAQLKADGGTLRPPDEVLAAKHARDESNAARISRHMREKRAAWEAKAREAIGRLGPDNDNEPSESDVQAIIDAMEWAQTQ